jgi:hypothetical protein
LKCSFIINTTHDCTCNRLFFVITMLRNLNMHIEIYLCSWSFDTVFLLSGIHFIYRIYEHASCFAYYLIPTFRLVYIGVIFFSHEFIITCIFIYVRVCLFLYSAHWTRSLKGQIHSYLRLRDLFKNKPRRIVNQSMTVFTSLVEYCHKYMLYIFLN